MIAHLNGTVAAVTPDGVVIDVGGVGLRVQCTPDTLASLRPGTPGRVATSLVVREDSLTLFGFATDDERNVFELLQTASGIGPRLALAMLAVHSPDALRRAVAAEDVKALTMVPGVGNKGAQRIILELKDRLGAPGDLAANGTAPARRAAAVLARPGPVGSGQPRLVAPRRRGGRRRGRGRLRRHRTRRAHGAPRRAAEAVAAVTDIGDALTGAEEAELQRRRELREDGRENSSREDSVVSPLADSDERAIESALRPKRLDDFVGQHRVREQLTLLLHSALRRGRPPDHVLLSGPPGLGKTTIAMIIAAELGAPLRITSGPAIERSGDLAAVLSTLQEGEVVFIDEIHRLARPAEEMLYLAMEDFRVDIVVGKGPGATAIPLDIAPFTLVGATTRAGLLPAPLRDRFGFTGTWTSTSPRSSGSSSGDRPGCSASGSRTAASRSCPCGHGARPGSPTGCSAGSATTPRSAPTAWSPGSSPGPRWSCTRWTSSALTGSTGRCSTR